MYKIVRVKVVMVAFRIIVAHGLFALACCSIVIISFSGPFGVSTDSNSFLPPELSLLRKRTCRLLSSRLDHRFSSIDLEETTNNRITPRITRNMQVPA